jgi:hypothetical protein
MYIIPALPDPDDIAHGAQTLEPGSLTLYAAT